MPTILDPKKVPAMNLLGVVLMSVADDPNDSDDCGILPRVELPDDVEPCQWCCGAGCQSCGFTGRGDTHEEGCDCIGCAR